MDAGEGRTVRVLVGRGRANGKHLRREARGIQRALDESLQARFRLDERAGAERGAGIAVRRLGHEGGRAGVGIVEQIAKGGGSDHDARGHRQPQPQEPDQAGSLATDQAHQRFIHAIERDHRWAPAGFD